LCFLDCFGLHNTSKHKHVLKPRHLVSLSRSQCLCLCMFLFLHNPATSIRAGHEVVTFAPPPATCAGAQAHERAEAAQQRAAMAEQAKIELTLALAEASEARAKDVDTHSHGGTAASARASNRATNEQQQGDADSAAAAAATGEGWGDAGWGTEDAADLLGDAAGNPAGGNRGRRASAARASDSAGAAAAVERVELPPGCTVVEAGEMEALLCRADEAELAAAVQTRRAAASELELDGLKRRLAEAEKQVGWSIALFECLLVATAGEAGMLRVHAAGGLKHTTLSDCLIAAVGTTGVHSTGCLQLLRAVSSGTR
jgi:hypothetical protein